MRLVDRKSVRSEHDDSLVPYLTLSHVWGDERFVTLTRDNVEQMKSSLRVSTLPQCFQDAIAMTRRLNVRYLWIDSLWYVYI